MSTLQKTTKYVLATVLIVVLFGSIAATNFSAYADHDNGNGKSKDDKNSHQKDRKGEGPKEPKRCEHGSSDKYNKHCE
jgi:hypothetical protein